MLLKRQDVTIKSFLWGERAAGKSDEIEAAVHEQRQYVSDIPTKFTVRTSNFLVLGEFFHETFLQYLHHIVGL